MKYSYHHVSFFKFNIIVELYFYFYFKSKNTWTEYI